MTWRHCSHRWLERRPSWQTLCEMNQWKSTCLIYFSSAHWHMISFNEWSLQLQIQPVSSHLRMEMAPLIKVNWQAHYKHPPPLYRKALCLSITIYQSRLFWKIRMSECLFNWIFKIQVTAAVWLSDFDTQTNLNVLTITVQPKSWQLAIGSWATESGIPVNLVVASQSWQPGTSTVSAEYIFSLHEGAKHTCSWTLRKKKRRGLFGGGSRALLLRLFNPGLSFPFLVEQKNKCAICQRKRCNQNKTWKLME